MSDRVGIQSRKLSAQTSTPLTVIPATRGFTSPTHATQTQEVESPRGFQKTPDLQTQLDRASRCGHNLSRMEAKINRPSVQPKLTISQPTNNYEPVADRMADQVMRMPEPSNHKSVQRTGISNGTLQTQKADKPISTPLDKDQKREKNGSAKLKIDDTQVIILPDNTGKVPEGSSAVTRFEFNQAKMTYKTDKKGIVTKISVSSNTVTIQTTYKPKVSPESQSAYGKGTTKEDKQAGTTSLRDHEGSHGSDYLKFLRDNPLPKFEGQEGMTKKEIDQAWKDYLEARKNYIERMGQFSKEHTDCIGDKGTMCN